MIEGKSQAVRGRLIPTHAKTIKVIKAKTERTAPTNPILPESFNFGDIFSTVFIEKQMCTPLWVWNYYGVWGLQQKVNFVIPAFHGFRRTHFNLVS